MKEEKTNITRFLFDLMSKKNIMYPSKLETEKIKSSINLVSKDTTTNNLVLNNEALNLIRDLDGKIAVCVCIGQYRSGKSFLLSNLFKYLTNSPYNAFQVGHEENSCTKGCWINKEIPILKAAKKSDQLHLIFIDTEVKITNILLFHFFPLRY